MKPYYYDHVRKINSPEEFEIYSSVTRAEACRLWDKWPKTIQNHIDKGNLVARRSEGTWQISVSSLGQLWGRPPEPPHATDLWWTWCKIDTILETDPFLRNGKVIATGA